MKGAMRHFGESRTGGLSCVLKIFFGESLGEISGEIVLGKNW
jgi:hypothetical protein